jgi:hypothetical protein
MKQAFLYTFQLYKFLFFVTSTGSFLLFAIEIGTSFNEYLPQALPMYLGLFLYFHLVYSLIFSFFFWALASLIIVIYFKVKNKHQEKKLL